MSSEEQPTTPHYDKVRSFERAKPNQLWADLDLFHQLHAKRPWRTAPRSIWSQFMDDHSALHRRLRAARLLHCGSASIESTSRPLSFRWGRPRKCSPTTGRSTSPGVGPQQVRRRAAPPRHQAHRRHATPAPGDPGQGRASFWGTLWREAAWARPSSWTPPTPRGASATSSTTTTSSGPTQGIDGLTPADRFFGAPRRSSPRSRPACRATLWNWHAAARPHRRSTSPGRSTANLFSVHSEGEPPVHARRVEAGQRTEIDLATARQIAGPSAVEQRAKDRPRPIPVTAHGLVNADLQHETEPPPGVSPLDEPLRQLHQSLADGADASEVSPIPEGGDL